MTDVATNADPRFAAALVGAAVASVGWFVAGLRERGRERRHRRVRQEDLQVALRAEIQHYVDILGNPAFDLNEAWREMVEVMERDPDYVPLIPTERNDTVFQAMIAEVHLLPEHAIQPVVRYYNQVFAIEAMIADLRADAFGRVSQSQRIKMYTDYISLKLEALEMGRTALSALDHSLARMRSARGFSSRAGARSDQR
ncbi:hypothetical protein ROJ8625_01167 [Roseivivax jejudonensis]|uniref:Uncharacterized protein n=1 Tax=Roseivivax jejudonensis TaxID=1529041 RepID=A0A1X6YQ16_9RHOB|nr:hypothetical protein [Roseivivax jejudonensis]SLN27972.1 hypothetical protein ROJ8625_01167 [Roseivivax jejudonensis]